MEGPEAWLGIRALALHAEGSRFNPQQPKIIKSGARVVLDASESRGRWLSVELRPVWSPEQFLHQPELLMRSCLKKSCNDNDNDIDNGNKVI